MAFPPVAFHAFTGTTPPSDFLSCISCSRFIITCSTYSLLERLLRISRVTDHSHWSTCHALQPRSSSMLLVMRIIEWGLPGGVPCRPACKKKLTRLNHFSLRLRPVALRPPCLTFGVTAACPMFATRWLTCLAGTGVSPAGLIDLARPHTPFLLFFFS